MNAAAASGHLRFVADAEAIHIRNGVIIGRRYCTPREPAMLRGMDPYTKAALLRSFAIDGIGLRDAYKLLRETPKNIVTTAGVTYMASNFSGTGNIDNFNFHAFGTGTNSGTTHTPGTATNATPIVVTDTAHGYGLNDIITIASYTGNTGANGIWEINPVTTNSYTLLGSVGNGASGGSPTSQRLNGAGDTAMVTDSGVTRVAGTQSNPTATQYRSVATLSFVSSLAIVEWGLFSASSAGTLWDRRWFNTAGAPSTVASAALVAAPINVISGDSIQMTYTLTISAGGS